MSLPSSGEIAFSMINEQLRRPTTQSYNLNDAQGRALAGAPSGAISMSNFHGKWAGSRMVCGYDSVNNIYGFKVGELGSLVGGYALADLREITWYATPNIIYLQTVVGADKPNSRLLRVTDDNFNLVATYNLPEWSASSNTWICLIERAPVNPFPNGQIRWFTW